jgi:hypothetical protein
MCQVVSLYLPFGSARKRKEGIVLIETGPPTAEALIQGIFGLQRKVRRMKGGRMWYRK